MKRNFVPALVFSTLVSGALPAMPAAAQMAAPPLAGVPSPGIPLAGALMPGVQIPGVQTAARPILPVQMSGAQMVCGKRTEIVQQLGDKYGETRRSLGLAGGRGVVELYASEETGSWTILLTSPQGTACMMAAGQAFQVEPAKTTGNPA